LSENASFDEYEKKMIANTNDERGVYYFMEIMFEGKCPEPGKFVAKPKPKGEFSEGADID